MDEIKESYHTIRDTYYDAFKSFRESMKVFIKESKGLTVDDAAKKAAIANIESLPDNSEKRNTILELKKMREEIKEEKQNQLEQLKKERKLERKSLKAEREEMKKSLKVEKENREEKNGQNDDAETSERSKNELKVEVEDGIAKIKIKPDSELEFQMTWTDKQTIVTEISSRTGLSVSEIESAVEFDIKDEANSDQDE